MKKTLFRIISILTLCCVLMVTTSIPVLATEIDVDTQPQDHNEILSFSEFEYISYVRDMTSEELTASGLSLEQIEMLTGNAVEEELLYRKTKTDAELRDGYGYTDEQIAILRAYSGTPIEDTPELLALDAVLTFSTPSVIRASETEMAVSTTWSWSSRPIITINDSVAVMWSGTYGTQNGNMRINTTSSYFFAQYWADSGLFVDTVKYYFTPTFPTQSAKLNFPMTMGSTCSARNGWMSVYFEATDGSAALTSFDLLIVYGHATFVLDASISLSAGEFNYSLGVGTSEAAVVSGYIDVSDKIWRYN